MIHPAIDHRFVMFSHAVCMASFHKQILQHRRLTLRQRAVQNTHFTCIAYNQQ